MFQLLLELTDKKKINFKLVLLWQTHGKNYGRSSSMQSTGAAYRGKILSKAQVMGLKTEKKSDCHCSHTVVDMLTNVSLNFQIMTV